MYLWLGKHIGNNPTYLLLHILCLIYWLTHNAHVLVILILLSEPTPQHILLPWSGIILFFGSQFLVSNPMQGSIHACTRTCPCHKFFFFFFFLTEELKCNSKSRESVQNQLFGVLVLLILKLWTGFYYCCCRITNVRMDIM